jgi:hypothetical protein
MTPGFGREVALSCGVDREVAVLCGIDREVAVLCDFCREIRTKLPPRGGAVGAAVRRGDDVVPPSPTRRAVGWGIPEYEVFSSVRWGLHRLLTTEKRTESGNHHPTRQVAGRGL